MAQAHSEHGSGHWRAQRVTAGALIFLGLWFLISILKMDDLGFDTVAVWMATPFNCILTGLAFATVAYHSKLGVQVVIEDYVHGAFINVLSLRLNLLAHVVLAAAGLYALLQIGFGV
jgi:succinate dehydrogenase / fumarate reductase membrane anchor subunit